MAETVVPLDVGCRPEAAVSGAILVQTERSTFLTFNAVRRGDDGLYNTAGRALLEFPGCSITRFGYPNDEAWCSIPRTRGLGYGVFEVHGSLWKEELARLNRFGFPDTGEWTGRHFLLLFHDSSFECIADDLRLEITEEPTEQLLARVTRRALQD
jgi:hypothetical protein